MSTPSPSPKPAAIAVAVAKVHSSMSKFPSFESFKKVWNSLKPTKNRVNRTQVIPHEVQNRQDVQQDAVYDTSPPAYTESPSNNGRANSLPERSCTVSYPLLTKFAYAIPLGYPNLDYEQLFIYCLMEIMAVTFSAKLEAIMIENQPEWKYSVLRQPFHKELLEPIVAELTALVRSLEEALANKRWVFVPNTDKELVRRWVLTPVQKRGINLDYVLEFLGRYDCNGGTTKTMVDYWTPKDSHNRSKERTSMLNLGDTIALHIMLLQSLQLVNKMQCVFDKSIKMFWEEKGLERLQTSKRLQKESLSLGVEGSVLGERRSWWPLSDGYMNLANLLRANEPNMRYNKGKARSGHRILFAKQHRRI